MNFGKYFKILSYRERDFFGIIIYGCPSGIYINDIELTELISKIYPSFIEKYNIKINIHSGIAHGITLGKPITIIVDYKNKHLLNTHYPITLNLKDNLTHIENITSFLIGGNLAEKWIQLTYGIETIAWVSQLGYLKYNINDDITKNIYTIKRHDIEKYINKCPNNDISTQMESLQIDSNKNNEILPGTITCVCRNIPLYINQNEFDKIEAHLAQAMISIQNAYCFEIEDGFHITNSYSTHSNYQTKKNIIFTVSFKPESIYNLSLQPISQSDSGIEKLVYLVQAKATCIIIDIIQSSYNIQSTNNYTHNY